MRDYLFTLSKRVLDYVAVAGNTEGEAVGAGANWHVAIVLHSLSVTGAARRVLSLAKRFRERGLRVTLLLVEGGGGLRDAVPDGVDVLLLSMNRRRDGSSGRRRKLQMWQALPNLIKALVKLDADVLMAGANHVHIAAFAAHRVAAPRGMALVMRISNSLDRGDARIARRRPIKMAVRRLAFRSSDNLLAVSRYVAEDAERSLRLAKGSVDVVPNPVVSPEVIDGSKESVIHPWFARGQPPVVLGVGRLHPQKDFETLIAAIARLRQKRTVRLVILGEGPSRAYLENAVRRHEVTDSVDMPGEAANPFAYMSAASVTALTSRWEGMSGVLIEAMACGCAVVSTDCPGGAREILTAQTAGRLVPVGESGALARAIEQMIDSPPPKATLHATAEPYRDDAAGDLYLDLLFPCNGTR